MSKILASNSKLHSEIQHTTIGVESIFPLPLRVYCCKKNNT